MKLTWSETALWLLIGLLVLAASYLMLEPVFGSAQPIEISGKEDLLRLAMPFALSMVIGGAYVIAAFFRGFRALR